MFLQRSELVKIPRGKSIQSSTLINGCVCKSNLFLSNLQVNNSKISFAFCSPKKLANKSLSSLACKTGIDRQNNLDLKRFLESIYSVRTNNINANNRCTLMISNNDKLWETGISFTF